MAITNFNGFNYINTILRKEMNGSFITPDRFNNSLNIKFRQKLDDEYIKFEKDQRNSDIFRKLKVNESIFLDAFLDTMALDGMFNLSLLSETYWHLVGASHNNSKIDVVNEMQWNERLSSSLEHPTKDYPIVKTFDGKLVFYPLKHEFDGTNLVRNAGYEGSTDWVDSNSDGVADDWINNYGTADMIVGTGEYNFEGNAQGGSFDTGALSFQQLNVLTRNTNVYFEFYYFLEPGTETVSLFNVGFSGLFVSVPINSVTGVMSKAYGMFTVPRVSSVLNTFSILIQLSDNEALRYFYMDKVFVSALSLPSEINITYLKEAATPYFDWYYDANDNIQYLEEGAVYTLKANETYIDKDDGSTHTVGAVIGSITDDAVNHTIEMEVPDTTREAVFYSMLSDFGVSSNNQLSSQYSIGMDSKENSK